MVGGIERFNHIEPTRLSRLSGSIKRSTRAHIVGLSLWAVAATGAAGWLAWETLTLETVLSGLPEELQATEQRLEKRATIIEKRHERMSDAVSRFEVLARENPGAPPVLERETLFELNALYGTDYFHSHAEGGPLAAEDPRGNPAEGPEGGPYFSDEEMVREPADAPQYYPMPRANPHRLNGGNYSYNLPDNLPLPGTAQLRKRAKRATEFDRLEPLNQIFAEDPEVVARVGDHRQSTRRFRDKAQRFDDLMANVEAQQRNTIENLALNVATAIAERRAILRSINLESMGVGGPLIELESNGLDANQDMPPLPTYGDKRQAPPFVKVEHKADPMHRADELLFEIDGALDELAALNDALVTLPLREPIEAGRYWMSSPYGLRRDPMTGHRAFHAGLDMAARSGSAVVATSEGEVTYAGRRGAYGNLVEIDHGNGFKTRYGHMRSVNVETGEKVAVGQIVGRVGNTGRSTGPHLHYEIWVDGRPQDPKNFVLAGQQITTLSHLK